MLAPLTVKLAAYPKHIDKEFTLRVGNALTVTDDTAVFELTQPKELVPTTLYDALVVGDTTAEPLEYV